MIEPLAQLLLALGDDELMLAHRDSEWTGHAPILEEDIAFGNIALDELGHAASWYRLLAELRGEDPESYPDQLVYRRPAREFRNVQMVELPIGDWAFSITRQYLFDAAESVRLQALARSDHTQLAAIAAKIRTEEIYHLRHLRAWVLRLGSGTEESNRRMQRALDQLYPYALQLFSPWPAGTDHDDGAQLPDPAGLQDEWEREVNGHLTGSGLQVPQPAAPPANDRSRHTEHLDQLVEQLQAVAGAHAGARW